MIRMSGVLVRLVDSWLDVQLLVFEERPRRMGFCFSGTPIDRLGWISDFDRFLQGEVFKYDYSFGIYRLTLYAWRGEWDKPISFWVKLFEIISDGRLLGSVFLKQAWVFQRGFEGG